MGKLKALGAAVLGGLAWLFTTLFGQMQWQPPAWLRAVWRLLRRRIVAQAAAAALLVGATAWGGWYWQKLHPRAQVQAKATATVPQNVGFHFDAPAVTCYDCDDAAQRAPKPLTVHFDAPIAPLARIGKELDGKDDAVRLKPAQAGAWKWQDDKTLIFTPSQDWPVGGHFEVAFARDGLILKDATLAQYGFAFDAAPFRISGEAEFVQDPVSPALKTAQFVLRFSHPIDDDSLRGRIRLDYLDLPDQGGQTEQPAPAYTLSFDASHLSATLRTANLSLPINSGRLDLHVDAGLTSKLGGASSTNDLQLWVAIPGRGALKVTELSAAIARDSDDTPVQTLTLHLSQSTTEDQVRGKVQAWLLPQKHPNAATQSQYEKAAKGNEAKPYPWDAATAAAFLKNAESLPLVYNPLEAEHSDVHSFRHSAVMNWRRPTIRWCARRITRPNCACCTAVRCWPCRARRSWRSSRAICRASASISGGCCRTRFNTW